MGRLAPLDHVVQQVGVAAVQEEHHHVLGVFAGQHLALGVAVLAAQQGVVAPLSRRSDAFGVRVDSQQGRHGGSDVHRSCRTVDESLGAHPGPGDDERRSGLGDPERAVLAEVGIEMVGRGVGGDQIGRMRGVEELRDRVPGVGIGVDRSMGEAGVELAVVADEAIGGVGGNGIAAGHLDVVVAVATAVGHTPEGHGASTGG